MGWSKDYAIIELIFPSELYFLLRKHWRLHLLTEVTHEGLALFWCFWDEYFGVLFFGDFRYVFNEVFYVKKYIDFMVDFVHLYELGSLYYEYLILGHNPQEYPSLAWVICLNFCNGFLWVMDNIVYLFILDL